MCPSLFGSYSTVTVDFDEAENRPAASVLAPEIFGH